MSKPEAKPPPPVFTAEMGAGLSYELLDDLIAEQKQAFEYFERDKRPSEFDRKKSDVWWAIKALRRMEAKGLIPPRTWFGLQAQQSIVVSNWVYSYLESKGFEVERTTTKGEPS